MSHRKENFPVGVQWSQGIGGMTYIAGKVQYLSFYRVLGEFDLDPTVLMMPQSSWKQVSCWNTPCRISSQAPNLIWEKLITILHLSIVEKGHVPFFKALLTHLRDGKLSTRSVASHHARWIKTIRLRRRKFVTYIVFGGNLVEEVFSSVGNVGQVAGEMFCILKCSSGHFQMIMSIIKWLWHFQISTATSGTGPSSASASFRLAFGNCICPLFVECACLWYDPSS